jgi:RHS repeat-associated protein
MNVTALVDTSGTVLERVVYDPYGNPTFYDGSWTSPSATSSYDNVVLYCGYRFDPETGLYHVRYRMYHATLGRWVQRDPWRPSTTPARGSIIDGQPTPGVIAPQDQYGDGMNLYQDRGSNPVVHVDSLGLKKCKWTGEIEGSGFGAILAPYQVITVSAHGTDDEGCCYGIRAEGSSWFTGGGMFAGLISAQASFTDFEAECEWPVQDGDPASLAIVGAGFSVGPVPVSLALVQGKAGDFLVHDGPFEVSGLNVFFPGGAMSVTNLNVTHRSGPTPCQTSGAFPNYNAH